MSNKSVGGQAFPFGVMMRCGDKSALAVRLRSGEIKVIKWKTLDHRSLKINRIPVLKTLAALSFTLVSSFYALGRFLILLPQCFAIKSPLDVLRYHGAEHKAIRCYEAGIELTQENVLHSDKFHPRCGSGLVAYVLLCELLAYIFTPKKAYKSNFDLVTLIALVVGMFAGYNAIIYSAKYSTKLARIMQKPSAVMQRFTVLQPRPYMTDCAIAAINAVLI